MSTPALSLIVLRTCQMETALSFYRALGLAFLEEKHGNGPVHYSTQVGSTVLEIYPGEPGSVNRKAGGATMLGFAVGSVDGAVAALQGMGSQVITAPTDSNWGRRAVVLDPDGRAVELSARN